MNINAKKRAAEKAVEHVRDGMIVGLGTGSTAYWAIAKIAEKVHEGLRVQAVASSEQSQKLAEQFGIPLIPLSELDAIDLTIDGADEADPRRNLIKGGGGALLREKMLASNSKKFIVIVDETKCVGILGRFPLPVEIIPFASNLTIAKLRSLNCTPTIRRDQDAVFVTDNGNLIVDCSFGEITEPQILCDAINSIVGVVENGLFTRAMVDAVVVGYQDDTVRIVQSDD